MNMQAFSWMRSRARRYGGVAAGSSYWRRHLPVLTVTAGMVLAVGLFASPAAAVAASTTPKPSSGTLTSAVTPNIVAPPDVIVSEADGHVNLPVTLSASSTQTVTVNYATANSTAGSGGNCNATYTGVSGTLTFSPGQTSKVVSVALLNCHLSTFLSFTFNLSGATNAAIVRPSTRIGIVGDPAAGTTAPGLYARSAYADNLDGSVTVPVLLGGPQGATSNSTVTVHYATKDNTAVAGTDYTAESGTLTFGPGQTVQDITVPILDRAGAAPTRNFTVTLSSPLNATLVQKTATVTIGASGATAVAAPKISAPPDGIVSEADGYLDFPVTLSTPATTSVTVNYATVNSTAGSGGNCNATYVGVPNAGSTAGTLTFTPGQTVQFVRVDLLNCELSTFLSFTFNLSGATNAAIVRPSTRIGIVGDPAAGTTAPGLYARSAYADNLDGSVTVPVLLGGPQGATSNSTVTVHYATKDNTAVAGTDYTAESGTLTFGPGQTVQDITVPILDRAGAAPTRNFTVTLSSPLNATLVQKTATVTIGASGATAVAAPKISAPPDGIVSEADGYLDFPVTLSTPATTSVTVNYATVNSTAGSGGNCNATYVGVPNAGSTAGTLTFTPGQTVQFVRVDLLNCGLSTFLSFTFNLSGATNAAIVRPSTRIGIVGDPAAGTTAPGLYARSAYADNLDGSVTVPVLLGGPQGATSNSTVTVHYATKDNTAVAGTDYTAESGTLTFGPGQTVQDITVPILDRAGAAPTRNFTVTLSSPLNATLVQKTATVTIGASGATAVAAPKISAPSNTIVGEATGYVDLPVTFNAPGLKTVTVKYATANGTAGSGTNCNATYVGVPNAGSTAGTLTFTPGQTVQFVRVDLLNCNLATPGTFTFNLSTATNATIQRATTTIKIVQHPAAISGFSPTSGPAGTTVTIKGQGLGGATEATFGTTAATITSDTATQITVTVPTGATTSQIEVFTPQGNAVSATAFTVT